MWTALVRWEPLATGENNGYCRGWQWQRFDTPEEARRAQQEARTGFEHLWNGMIERELLDTDPTFDCPRDPADELPPALVREAVEDSVRGQLPRPTPEVPPGHAITGLPAFLVTNHEVDGGRLTYGPVTHELDLGRVTLEVTVEAEGYSRVDWGDGRIQDYHTIGLPYPHGEIRHTYADVGAVDITITDVWEVRFDVPGVLTDSIVAELAPVTLTAFPVEEMQAVRTTSR